MNLPNQLTLSRFFLTILFVAVLSVDFSFHQTVGLGIFIIASITDYVDGEIARRYALVTTFGKLMDPLVDKIMTAAAFVCLVPLKAIPAWAAVIVISREFLITGLRLLAVTKGRILAADPIGKHKTSWQIATVDLFPAARFLPGMDDLPSWHFPRGSLASTLGFMGAGSSAASPSG